MATTSAILFLACGEQHLLPLPMAAHVAFLRCINRTIQSINQRFAHIFCSQDDDIKNVRYFIQTDSLRTEFIVFSFILLLYIYVFFYFLYLVVFVRKVSWTSNWCTFFNLIHKLLLSHLIHLCS
jgi:hypothetical protein